MLTTLHAGSAHEAISRLILMARFGMDLPTSVIEMQIASALDFVLMSRRTADGSRYLASLSSVGESSEGGVELHECVRFDEIDRSWELIEEPDFVEQGLHEGVLDEEEVEAWRGCLA